MHIYYHHPFQHTDAEIEMFSTCDEDCYGTIWDVLEETTTTIAAQTTHEPTTTLTITITPVP